MSYQGREKEQPAAVTSVRPIGSEFSKYHD